MQLGLEDRVAIVCGASRGLGLAIATSLARAGSNLVLCARSPGPLEEAARSLRELGVQALAVPGDVTKGDDLRRLVETANSEFGRVDVLVNNTGHPKMGSFSTLSEEDWRGGFETIFVPMLRLCHHVLPIMQRQRWGRIINISSHAIRNPSSTYLLSGVYRTALASLSKSLANEYGRDGILVNSVCPGLIRTPLGESLLRGMAERRGVSVEQAESEHAAQCPARRIGEPEEIGAIVTFLCSAAASHITGQLLTVDGGQSPGLF